MIITILYGISKMFKAHCAVYYSKDISKTIMMFILQKRKLNRVNY